ncbi:sugar ABC transporter permease [Gryllotalpicola protaetiae]|uniref:Sugar ABC transporter permease n=1 Tax=Gryllotalpicola protaetiae TaxID=2419771 RepID=A0A387BWQ2_9MICO|nr:sugar ABC transporter permease [Gryllotalpicola protaetiae]
MVPLLVVNVCVIAGPGLMSVYYSMTDWQGFGPANFIGFANYVRMFGDADFLTALLHNLIWTAIFLVVPMGMALLGAYLLSRLRRFATLFRALYFIPYIVASVVSSTIWSSLLAGSGIGSVIGINFLGNPSTALPAVAVANVWTRWGFLAVIFFAAMQSVNPSLYEASSLDGASTMQQFFHVTLPSIRPTLMFMGLMSVIWSFLVFDWIYIMTQGGPAGSTEVLSTLLYREAFTSQEAGYASAIGVVLALISGVIVGGYQFLRARKGWDI